MDELRVWYCKLRIEEHITVQQPTYDLDNAHDQGLESNMMAVF